MGDAVDPGALWQDSERTALCSHVQSGHGRAAARRKGQTEGWVFPSKRKASAGHLTTVARAFRALRQKLGLSSKLVLYSARHTFGTRVLAATGNLAAVMKAMGHASAQTAMIYQHPSLDLIRQAVEESEENPAMSQTRHKPVLLQ